MPAAWQAVSATLVQPGLGVGLAVRTCLPHEEAPDHNAILLTRKDTVAQGVLPSACSCACTLVCTLLRTRTSGRKACLESPVLGDHALVMMCGECCAAHPGELFVVASKVNSWCLEAPVGPPLPSARGACPVRRLVAAGAASLIFLLFFLTSLGASSADRRADRLRLAKLFHAFGKHDFERSQGSWEPRFVRIRQSGNVLRETTNLQANRSRINRPCARAERCTAGHT